MSFAEDMLGLVVRVVIMFGFCGFWFYTWYKALEIATGGNLGASGILGLMNAGVAWAGKYLFEYLFNRSKERGEKS